ncbi:MAG: hypothetical protein IJO32_00865 [Bacilli bacterium]|nr:hypothetical protein [Bacilli bacterium]
MKHYKLIHKNKNVEYKNYKNGNILKLKIGLGILSVSLTAFSIANPEVFIDNTQNVIYTVNEFFSDSGNIENLDTTNQEYLKEFENKLYSNIPSQYLKNYNNNINNLKYYNNNNDLNKIVGTSGYYDVKTNRMVNILSNRHVIFHELMHMASSNGKYCGFSNGKTAIGLTEGYTEYLVKFLFPDKYIGYPKEVQIIKILNSIIGEEKIMQYYFTNNLEGLKKDLISIYGTQKDVDNLIKLIDNYNITNDDKILSEIAQLLLKYCYSHQQKQESNFEIDTNIRIFIYNMYNNDNFNELEENVKEEITNSNSQKKFN